MANSLIGVSCGMDNFDKRFYNNFFFSVMDYGNLFNDS